MKYSYLMKIVGGLWCFGVSVSAVCASNWYVSGIGSDSNPGSLSKPFLTLNKAASVTNPGDTVYVENGTYTTQQYGKAVLTITRSGQPGKPITYKPAPNNSPVISVDQNAEIGIQIYADYINITGLTLNGNALNMNATLAEKISAEDPNDPRVNGSGIGVSSQKSKTVFHHIVISNNTVKNMCGYGIGTAAADYITIQHNTVSNCAHWSAWANSGISIYGSQNYDSYTGYKNFVMGNISVGNAQLIAGAYAPHITDGEGILIDDTNNDQQGFPPYIGRTLVENNYSDFNGSAGIEVFDSSHVDVINNTAYDNQWKLQNGDIFVLNTNTQTDVTVFNNIAVNTFNIPPLTLSGNTNGENKMFVDYNLCYGPGRSQSWQ